MSFGFGLGYSADAEHYSLSMIKVTTPDDMVHQAG